MPAPPVLLQANNFLSLAANRDKMARFTASLCKLLLEYLKRSQSDRKDTLAQLSAVVSTLKTTRNSFQWLRQISIAVQLSKLPPLQSFASYCKAISRLCMLVFVTLRNVDWLITMRIMKGDGPSVLKLAFKFYALSWLCELLARLKCMDSKKLKSGEVLLSLRDASLVVEGLANAGLQQVDPAVLAIIGMMTSSYDCYLNWG
eukprot:GGOE01021322.1.p1 GENE.GGOE01021322.1~~GGOE01021322.1.p1  ORF type:complete len:202 (-),score=65.85 GGOE01021322.1:401-1006(-)